MTELMTVAFDIETTGFETADELTVIGFDSVVASRVFLNTGGTTPPENLAERLNETFHSDYSHCLPPNATPGDGVRREETRAITIRRRSSSRSTTANRIS